jgi:OFA family oxalate/formate antiporter-like MFS transporter
VTQNETLFGGRPEQTRWLFVVVGIVINLCLGSVYAYSIFKPAVEKVHGVKAFMGNLPFMAFLLFFSILMFFGGRLMGRLGPRRLALIGGVIVGLGWMLSSLAGSIWMLVLTYGVVAGSGVGLVYGCPVAMGARWFPDRKGLAVGLMLAGFGGSALITGKIASGLIGNVAAQLQPVLAGNLAHAFMTFGMVFTVILILLALPLRFPTPGWKPAGWEPKAGTAAAADFAPAQMARTPSFWGLFVCYVIGCLAGLMAIGISRSVGSDVIKISGELAATLVGVFAAFNAIGRPLFGWLTDRITPRGAAVVNLCILLVVSVLMIAAGEGSTGLYVVAFIGFWLCLGGWLAIAPTATATFFGMKNYASNYGLVFIAYGLGAILGGIISGKAADVFGAYTYAFYPTAVLAAIGIVLALLLIKPPRQVPA